MIGFITLFQREIGRFLKVIVQTVVTPLVSSLLYLLVFGVSLGHNIQLSNGVDYLAFLIPGLVMMGLMNNAFQNSASSIVNSKYTGELEDLRVVPLSHSVIVWAMSFGAVVRGGLVGLVTFIVGFVFYWLKNGQLLPINHPFEFLFFVVLGGLVFGKMGIAAAFWARSFDQLSAVSAFVILPLTYLGGVFISIETLHPVWQSISKLNPLFYFINGLRHSILGTSDVEIGTSMLVVFGSMVILHFIALRSLKKGSFSRW